MILAKHRFLLFSLGSALRVGIIRSWPASAQTPFYQGKTINLIVGSAPGGTGDLSIKATLPYLTKYISGRYRNIVAQYVTGAGGRTAANQMYKQAKPDEVSPSAIRARRW